LVMAGLVPAIPIIRHCAIPIEIAGTSPAMTPRVLRLLPNSVCRSIATPRRCRQRWLAMPTQPHGTPDKKLSTLRLFKPEILRTLDSSAFAAGQLRPEGFN
jgi:hypothetical protein